MADRNTPNTLGHTNSSTIEDRINNIQLGPSTTENGGQILDRSEMSPEAAGNAYNQAALQRLQAENANGLAQVREENARNLNAIAQQIATLGQANAGQPQAPLDPYQNPEYQLDANEEAELNTLLPGVDKRSRAAAEKAKQEALRESQALISQSTQAYEQRIAQLEAKIDESGQRSDTNFRAQLGALAAQFGLNSDTLGDNQDWNARMRQPVSAFDSTPMQTRAAEMAKAHNLDFFRTLFQEHVQMYGSTAGMTGFPQGQNNQPNNNQFAQGNNQMGMPGGGNGGGMPQQPALNSQAGAQLREIDSIVQSIHEQRANYKRQLMDERSITREVYAEEMNKLQEQEYQLEQKRKALAPQ